MSPQALMISITAAVLALLAGSFALVFWRIGRLRRARAAAQSWPSTQGTIVAAEVQTLHFSLPRGGSIVRFGANITYEYSVGDVGYRNSRFNVDGPMYYASQRKAEAMLARFPVGAEVTVFYDPAAPENSVLARRAPSIATLWFALVFSSILAAALLVALASEPGIFGRDPIIRF